MVKSWALEPDAWDQVLAPTLTTYETLGKSFNLSMPQFPHLLSGDDSTYFLELWRVVLGT